MPMYSDRKMITDILRTRGIQFEAHAKDGRSEVDVHSIGGTTTLLFNERGDLEDLAALYRL